MEGVALSSLQAGGPNRSTCEPLAPASCYKAGSPCCIAPPVLHGCARTRPPTFEAMLMQLSLNPVGGKGKSNIVFSLKDDKQGCLLVPENILNLFERVNLWVYFVSKRLN